MDAGETRKARRLGAGSRCTQARARARAPPRNRWQQDMCDARFATADGVRAGWYRIVLYRAASKSRVVPRQTRAAVLYVRM
jgi:hypothetical protein